MHLCMIGWIFIQWSLELVFWTKELSSPTSVQQGYSQEVNTLKRRVKRLKKKKRLRTHRLKRLYKVGLTARVESSRDEECLGEDASKQGRINAIDADEDTTMDKGKGITVEEHMKSMTKKDLVSLDEEIASKLQAEFDKEERLAREKDEANVALTEEWMIFRLRLMQITTSSKAASLKSKKNLKN
ncbi:hypothetical protein Tco_0548061 [Tanacetum coccineum]